jgi:hypothetical protein
MRNICLFYQVFYFQRYSEENQKYRKLYPWSNIHGLAFIGSTPYNYIMIQLLRTGNGYAYRLLRLIQKEGMIRNYIYYLVKINKPWKQNGRVPGRSNQIKSTDFLLDFLCCIQNRANCTRKNTAWLYLAKAWGFPQGGALPIIQKNITNTTWYFAKPTDMALFKFLALVHEVKKIWKVREKIKTSGCRLIL